MISDRPVSFYQRAQSSRIFKAKNSLIRASLFVQNNESSFICKRGTLGFYTRRKRKADYDRLSLMEQTIETNGGARIFTETV